MRDEVYLSLLLLVVVNISSIAADAKHWRRRQSNAAETLGEERMKEAEDRPRKRSMPPTVAERTRKGVGVHGAHVAPFAEEASRNLRCATGVSGGGVGETTIADDAKQKDNESDVECNTVALHLLFCDAN